MKISSLKRAATTAIVLSLAAAFVLQPVQSEAAKSKKMYVITNDGCRFDYNKNGLIKQKKGDPAPAKFTYVKNKPLISKINYTYPDGSKYEYSFKYDKKERLVKISNKYKKETHTIYYTWKKNKVVKKLKVYNDGKGTKLRYTWKYTYKNGMLSEITTNYHYMGKAVIHFKWSNKGDIARYSLDNSKSYTTHKINYKKDRPVSWIMEYHDDEYGIDRSAGKIVCKRINVPAKYVKAVKAQQRAIRNEISRDMPLLGIDELGLYDLF